MTLLIEEIQLTLSELLGIVTRGEQVRKRSDLGGHYVFYPADQQPPAVDNSRGETYTIPMSEHLERDLRRTGSCGYTRSDLPFVLNITLI